jgi:hypothetical protein
MKRLHGQNLGYKLCQLFGLDSNKIEHISILCNVNDYVRVEVVYVSFDTDLELVMDEIREYELVDKA